MSEVYIDGIPIQDYGTPQSRTHYSKNFNLNIGDTNKVSEEEIKAIKYLEDNALVRVNENGEIVATGNAYKMVVLNLIDKLQKENEELKIDNKALCEMAFIRPIQLPYTTSFTSTYDFISKDKIKNVVNNFIEEMNKILEE